MANDMLNGSGDLKPGEFDLNNVAPPDSSISAEPVTLEMAKAMNWELFEVLAVVLYAKRGYEVYRTPPTKDNGVDVVAMRRSNGKGKLVQTKTSGKEGAALSWDAIKEVVAGHAFYAKQFPDVTFERVCLTNQYFDQQAHLNAGLNQVELIEQAELAKMLSETPIEMIEIEKILYSDWTDTQFISTM